MFEVHKTIEGYYVALDLVVDKAFIIGDLTDLVSLRNQLTKAIAGEIASDDFDDRDERLGVRWLTTEEAIIELHKLNEVEFPLNLISVTSSRLRQAAKAGNLKYKKVGRKFKYEIMSLRTYVKKCRKMRSR